MLGRELRCVCSGADAWSSPARRANGVMNPGAMPRVGTVDQRFQSYNIEMVEVTGGRFWEPYDSTAPIHPRQGHAAGPGQPGGMPAYLLRVPAAHRPEQCRGCASWRRRWGRLTCASAAPGPTRLFFQDSDEPAPAKPPAGFNSVLTRKEWKGVVDFAHAAHARL